MMMLKPVLPPIYSSPPQKKNYYQRIESISLGEVKHLVSLLDKGGKNALSSHFWEEMCLPILADLPLHLGICRLRTAVLMSACRSLHGDFFEPAHDL